MKMPGISVRSPIAAAAAAVTLAGGATLVMAGPASADPPLPFTSGTSAAECPVFSVALRVGHDCCWRSGTAVNATRPLL